MKFRGSDAKAEKIEPPMAPMIDVVFQLLIFFMLTLKIIEPEGSFTINMPQGDPAPDPEQQVPKVVLVTMNATADGTLTSIEYLGTKQTPVPESDPTAIEIYRKQNDLSAAQAAMRLGEDKLFKQLNNKVAEYVRTMADGAEDREELDKELKAKITFPYQLKQRYIIKATSACRGRVRFDGEKERREELIKNIEFVRPKP